MSGKRYTDIYSRDDWTCQFCGNRAITVDHLVPVIAGGSNEELNLVGACARCNRVKADMRLPNLVNSFYELLKVGRTRGRGYPILLWQALLLGYPVEDIPWSQAKSRWCKKAVADVLFNHPDEARRSLSQMDADKVVQQIRPYDPLSSKELLNRLVKEGYILEHSREYRWGLKAPPSQQREGLALPLAPKRVESAFSLVGEARVWFTAKELKRDIDRGLAQLGVEPTDMRKQVWDVLLQKRWVYSCDPYFLVDRRKPLKRYVVTAWRQLVKSSG